MFPVCQNACTLRREVIRLTDSAGEVHGRGALLVEEFRPLCAEALNLLAGHGPPLGMHLLKFVGVLIEVGLIGGGEVGMAVGMVVPGPRPVRSVRAMRMAGHGLKF